MMLVGIVNLQEGNIYIYVFVILAIERFYRFKGNIELTAEFSMQLQILVRPPTQYR